LWGASTILTTERGYRLADDVAVDADRFERAVDEGRTSGAWDDAIASSGGVPFEDLGPWPPAEARRARIEELHRSALECRLDALLETGAGDTLVPELEALVKAEPLREKRWCLLVQALRSAGRRAEALRAVERARRVFIAELGIEPGVELTTLYEALLVEGGPVDRESIGEALELCDRRYADANAARDSADLRGAVLAYCHSARLARGWRSTSACAGGAQCRGRRVDHQTRRDRRGGLAPPRRDRDRAPGPDSDSMEGACTAGSGAELPSINRRK